MEELYRTREGSFFVVSPIVFVASGRVLKRPKTQCPRDSSTRRQFHLIPVKFEKEEYADPVNLIVFIFQGTLFLYTFAAFFLLKFSAEFGSDL